MSKLIHVSRGRDACGINHDELNANFEEQLKELRRHADLLAAALSNALALVTDREDEDYITAKEVLNDYQATK